MAFTSLCLAVVLVSMSFCLLASEVGVKLRNEGGQPVCEATQEQGSNSGERYIRSVSLELLLQSTHNPIG